MDSIVELVKRNEQLLLENAEALNDEEVEQEDIDEYLKIQGATKEELSAFENQFQIRLPEDFKTVYSYKNGSGYMSLIWPQEGFYRGYRLLSLKEIIKLKSLFQNKNCKMTEFPNVIGEKQLQTSVYKGYKQDKIEMRGDRAEMSDFPLYLNTVAGGLDRRDQTIGGFSFVVKIYAVPVVEIIG